MKNSLLAFLLFFSVQSFSQEVEKASWQSENFVKFDAQLRFQVLYPIQFGNYALSKAYDSNPGVGVNMSFLNIKNFKIGAGYNIEFYKVTDKQLMGNFNIANYSSVFGTVNYELKIAEKVSFYPNIGVGYAMLKQKAGSSNFGHQDGIEYRAGFITDYKFNKTVSLFFGANYIYSKYQINTAPEYEKFFGNSQKIQLSIGLQIE